jgi:hypothetical protein
LTQISDVRKGFWIPEVHAEHAARVFWPWCSGLSYLDVWEKSAWVAVIALCLGTTVLRRDLIGYFFLLQAGVPWAASIALSAIWGRSIFYDRYLSFAQWALLCYWGTTCSRLPSPLLRLVVACIIAASALAGLQLKTSQKPAALAQAAEFLRKHALADDAVWVSGPAEINLMRYYTSQVGLLQLGVKCPVHLGGKGHQVHLASLSGEDVLGDEPLKALPRRFWKASVTALDLVPGTRVLLRGAFQNDVIQYHLALYERTDGL